MTENTAAQTSGDGQLRARAVWEEVAGLEKHMVAMRTLACDARLVALSRHSRLYREIRQGYLDAEAALRQAAERIEAETHD